MAITFFPSGRSVSRILREAGLGTHMMTVTKEAPTTGAAILDAFYLTTNANDTPPEPTADNRYTFVAPQPSTTAGVTPPAYPPPTTSPV